MDDPLLKNLTDAQCQAVLHVDGPLLILAGPGSGKTRVVTHRIANLLRTGIAPQRILALTFTNKAADEMRRRVERLAPGKAVWLSTFHRFCAKLLREQGRYVGLSENFTIYDTSDSKSALKRAVEAVDLDLGHFTPDQIAHHISWAKNNLIPSAQYQPRPGHPLGAIAAKVYPAYQALLLKSNAVDFDDLLLHTAMLLKENPEVRTLLDARYRYIMVDEYQDTNLAQYAIVRALSLDYPNLSVTGDPDQSIYGWRGANLSNILEFENDYPDVNVVRLEQNYRSTKSILRAAAHLIAYNKKRKEKGLFTDNVEGQPVRLTTYGDNREEAASIAAYIHESVRTGRRRYSDFAVFYRINALSRTLEFAFRDAHLPYQIAGGVEFFQRKEIKNVIAYLRLLNNPVDDEACLRVINTPARGIGKTTLQRIVAVADRNGISMLEAARAYASSGDAAKKIRTALTEFVALIDRLGALTTKPVEELLGHILSESGYREELKHSDVAEDEDRLANVEELLTAARDFDERRGEGGGLEEFLEMTALVNDVDALDGDNDVVTMMTLHASKGLEYPVVFITAVEEGLLPHERSREHPDELEEERRLLFVGITRAQEELHLSTSRYREFRGQRRLTVPSQFLMELPVAEFDRNAAAARVWETFDDSPPPEDDDHVHALNDEIGDDSFDVTSFETPPSSAQGTTGASPFAVKTAAELAGEARVERPAVSPEAFAQGMAVRHPQYGLGKIIALSGAGSKRVATIAFATSGQKKFILAQSPLRPMKG